MVACPKRIITKIVASDGLFLEFFEWLAFRWNEDAEINLVHNKYLIIWLEINFGYTS